MNSEYNYERTVDLRSFLKAVLNYWRSMLILGVVCSLCLGIVPVIEYKTGNKGISSAEDEVTDETEEYISEEEYTDALERIETIMAGKRQYLANSYLMKIDPFNVVVAKESVYVDLQLSADDLRNLLELDTMVEAAALSGLSNPEENTDSSAKASSSTDTQGTEISHPRRINSGVQFLESRLLDEYVDFLTGRIDWSELAEELGTEPKYIDECVTAESHIESAKIVITVKNYDTDIAGRIREYAVEKLQEEKAALDERLCSHELQFNDGGVEIMYDYNLRNSQETFISEIATSETRYDNFKDAKSSYVFNAPTQASLNKKAILRNLILGFIAGVLLASLLGAIRIFLKGRVISTKELQLSYDLKPLASLRSSDKKKMFSGVDAWIEGIGMGSDGKLSDDEKLRKAAQMVELYSLDAEKIILTGDVTEDELKTITGKLQGYLKGKQLEYCDTLLGQTARLRDSNGVIFVEKKNKSRLSEIEQDIGIIGEMKIPVIGVILL